MKFVSAAYKEQRSRLTWTEQHMELNPLEKLEWDMNDEPDLVDFIWTSSALHPGSLTLGAQSKPPLFPPISGTGMQCKWQNTNAAVGYTIFSQTAYVIAFIQHIIKRAKFDFFS